ncbi:MAG: hypothetical protein ACRDJY_11335 [Thermoleophilaceae bacterium]
MQLLGRDYLKIYLEDHYAGATAGLELARRTAGGNRGTLYGDALEEIAREIEEDREALRAIMAVLDVGPDRFKVAGAWAGEKAGRLKLNGHLTSYSPQSRVTEVEGLVIGVTGKRCLWAALRHIEALEPRLDIEQLDQLIERADRQLGVLEELRLKAVSEAVAVAERTTS